MVAQEVYSFLQELRQKNPRIDRNSVTDYQEMQRYRKYCDLPEGIEELLTNLWDIVKDKRRELSRRLSDRNGSIEVYHELVVGYSLYEHCKKHSLDLEYSPELQYSPESEKQTPDWVIGDSLQKVIVEVSTKNDSQRQESFNICLSLIILFVERELNRYKITEQLDYVWSRFVIPKPCSKEKCKKYTKFCTETADRIAKKIISGEYKGDWLIDEESGLEVKLGLGTTSGMTTRGFETVREIRRILDKGNNYKQLSEKYPLIVAVASTKWARSKAYAPQDIVKILCNSKSVYLPEYSRIPCKSKLVDEIEKRKEDLEAIEGVLFYNIEYHKTGVELPEYYPIKARRAIPDKFCSYLNIFV